MPLCSLSESRGVGDSKMLDALVGIKSRIFDIASVTRVGKLTIWSRLNSRQRFIKLFSLVNDPVSAIHLMQG